MKWSMEKQKDQLGGYCWNSDRDNSGSNQGGCKGHSKKRSDPGHILKVKLTGLADGWYVGEGGARDESKFGCLDVGSCLFQNGQKCEREVLNGEVRSLIWDLFGLRCHLSIQEEMS